MSRHVAQHLRRKERQQEALERQAARAKRTDFEQTQLLLERRGHCFREMGRLVGNSVTGKGDGSL